MEMQILESVVCEGGRTVLVLLYADLGSKRVNGLAGASQA
jgi:hypothetical protein